MRDRIFYSTFGVLFCVILFTQLVLHFGPSKVKESGIHFNLEKWEACYIYDEEPCSWTPYSPPSSIRLSETPKKIVLKTSFATPDWCSSSHSCSIFIGTVSDPAIIKVNGREIGEIGSPRTSPKYSQTYPFKSRLSQSEFKLSNQVRIELYPTYSHPHGLIRGPVRIAPSSQTRTLYFLITAHTIGLPFFTGIFLLLLFLIGLMITSYSSVTNTSYIFWFLTYTFVMGLYALSLTRIPREFMHPKIGIDLHFFIRCLTEVAHIFLILATFAIKSRFLKTLALVHLFIGFALATNALFGVIEVSLLSDLLDSARLFFRKSIILYTISPIVAAYLAWRSFKKGNTQGLLFVIVYSLVSVMVANDFLALNGFSEDIYFVRSYPLFIALTHAFIIWQLYSDKRKETRKSQELGKLSAQVAHDLAGPITALKMISHQSSSLGTDEKEFLDSVAHRIEGVSSDVLSRFNSAKAKKINVVEFSEKVNDLLLEIRLTLTKNVKVKFTPKKISKSIFIESNQILRALSNVVNNAIDASKDGDSVNLTFDKTRSSLSISVADSGEGMDTQTLQKALSGGYSTKNNGHGIGLNSSKKLVELNEGSFKISSSPGSGTTVTIDFPFR